MTLSLKTLAGCLSTSFTFNQKCMFLIIISNNIADQNQHKHKHWADWKMYHAKSSAYSRPHHLEPFSMSHKHSTILLDFVWKWYIRLQGQNISFLHRLTWISHTKEIVCSRTLQEISGIQTTLYLMQLYILLWAGNTTLVICDHMVVICVWCVQYIIIIVVSLSSFLTISAQECCTRNFHVNTITFQIQSNRKIVEEYET